MAISGALLTKVNAALNDLATRIQNRQAIYFAARGKYWQGIITPFPIPTNGTDTAPDKTRRPTDQIEDWIDINLPATIPVSIEVHTHNGPLGQGYTMMAWAQVSADGLYLRSRGVGAYGVTSAGWDKVLVG